MLKKEWLKNVRKKNLHSVSVKNVISPIVSCNHVQVVHRCAAASLTDEGKEGKSKNNIFG